MTTVYEPIVLPLSLLGKEESLSVVRVPHPRTRLPAHFILCPNQGIWELQAVSSPAGSSRCWFYQPDAPDRQDLVLSRHGGRLLCATPIDPFFILLGLLCGTSTDFEGFGGTTADGRQSCFEQVDVMLDRAQEQWSFSDGTQQLNPDDLELLLAECARPDTLGRICAELQQDEETVLWRRDRDKVVQEIQNKVSRLACAAKAAGKEKPSVWMRLAVKEGLLGLDEGTPDAASLTDEIFQKVALGIVEAYLPPVVHAYLCKTTYSFTRLDQLKSQQNHLDLAAGTGRRTDDPSATKPKPVKRKPQKEPTRGARTLGDMWGSPAPRSGASKKTFTDNRSQP